MKPRKCLANALVALVPAVSILMVGCKGETPSAPSTMYTIRASAGENGTISPSGDTQVRQGGTLTYTFIPGSSKVVKDVLVDGVSVGAVSSYPFENVSASHVIAVTFKDAPPTNMVANGDMETAKAGDSTAAAGWVLGGWGTQTLTSPWLQTGGHNSDHALQINITAYTDGAREWYFDPVPANPGTKYVYSCWYKSDVSFVAGIWWCKDSISDYTYADGNSAPAASDWTHFTFTTPAMPDGKNCVTIGPIIKTVGSITIDDVSLTVQPAE